MFFLKKLIFKVMELGLGLRTCFSLETRNPIFLNFKLSEEEAREVQKGLPQGFTLKKIRFYATDTEPAFWLSYNLYELKYPKKELEHIRKARCEINTFVEDPAGRKGIYVFCGSPYVSRETSRSFIGVICDFAERMVTFIYGVGKLTNLKFHLSDRELLVDLSEGQSRVKVAVDVSRDSSANEKLSDEYWLYNDISFFNEGRTYDLVNVSNAFYSAKFSKVQETELAEATTPFFTRRPDSLHYHRGDIAYLVNSMNRT